MIGYIKARHVILYCHIIIKEYGFRLYMKALFISCFKKGGTFLEVLNHEKRF